MDDLSLSVLVPTVPSRLESFLPRLLCDLESQADGKPVEILALYDNKRRPAGAKRNALLSIAQGRYVVFVDDDDRLAPDYIDTVVAQLVARPDADVVVYDCLCTVAPGGKRVYGKYSVHHPFPFREEPCADGLMWYGKPAHTMVWRRELVQDCRFSDRLVGEDLDWVALAWPRVRTEVRIDRVLYYYDRNPATSECPR